VTAQPTYFLAIDNGSQSTKVSIVDDHGEVHGFAQHPLRPYDTREGRVVHPGDDVWESIQAATRSALARFTPGARAIAAVGLCTIRFCRALMDENGFLTEPLLSWMDPRVGRPFDPSASAARYVATSSGYVAHRLTGRFVDAAGNYQGMWPIDQDTWRWSDHDEDYRRTGMPRERLLELVDPGELLGEVTRDAASVTGLRAGTPVFATSNDKAVEALGSGLNRPGRLLLSLGTYITSMAVGTRRQRGEGESWRNFGAISGQYLHESGGIRRGMWTVSWFRDLVGARDDDELNAEAAAVPIGSGGLYTILDWLAPDDAPHRRGAMIGFDGSQGRAAIYRSILEGIAFTMAARRAELERELDTPFAELVVSGGGSRSALMAEILADAYNLPVLRPAVPDAAGIGAAISAAVGCGRFDDWAGAVAAMVRFGSPIEPNASRAASSRIHAERYALIRQRTDAMLAETGS